MLTSNEKFERRKKRVRYQIKKNAKNSVRLSVYRSLQHIYVQIIDDKLGKTIASASSLEIAHRQNTTKKTNIEVAKVIGHSIAEKAKNLQIESIVFDRGGYKYHGRIKALADAARENGLKF